MNFKRIFVIVTDSLGVGEMPNSDKYGDKGTNTLKHLSYSKPNFSIPTLAKMGIGNITDVNGTPANGRFQNFTINIVKTVKTYDAGTTTRIDDVYYYEAIAAFKPEYKGDSVWDKTVDPTSNADITIKLWVELKDPVAEGYTITVSPSTSSHLHTGSAITFDVKVILTKLDGDGNEEKIELVEPANATSPTFFIVDWYRNVDLTTSTKLAYFNVRSIPSGEYSFVVGNYLDPDDPKPGIENTDELDLTKAAGTFSIYEKVPDYIKIADSAKYVQFRKYVVDEEVDKTEVSRIDYDTRKTFVEQASIPTTEIVLLAGFIEGQTLDFLLNSLENFANRIEVIELKSNQTIFDGRGLADDAVGPFPMTSASGVATTDLYKIRTGLKVILFSEGVNHTTAKDSIVTVLYGDFDGNGSINKAGDVNGISKVVNNAIYPTIDLSKNSPVLFENVQILAAKVVALDKLEVGESYEQQYYLNKAGDANRIFKHTTYYNVDTDNLYDKSKTTDLNIYFDPAY